MHAITRPDGSSAEVEQDRSRVVLNIYQEWAGNDRFRIRQLAILQLLGDGWSKSEIARGMLSGRANISRSINRARISLRKYAHEKGINLESGTNGGIR